MAGRRLKDGEGPTAHKKDSRKDQQGPAIAYRRLQKAAIVVCQKKSLSGRSPARSKHGSSRRASLRPIVMRHLRIEVMRSSRTPRLQGVLEQSFPNQLVD